MKKMKFWFDEGEQKAFDRVMSILEDKGSILDENLISEVNHPINGNVGVQVNISGNISASCRQKDNYWIEHLSEYEEINIDWLRDEPIKTIEWQGDVYREKDFLNALSKLEKL